MKPSRSSSVGHPQALRLARTNVVVVAAGDTVAAHYDLDALPTAGYVDARLAPGAGVAELRAVVGEVGKPAATVGHQPDCSEIAIALTGNDPGFPPAGVAAIELDP